MNIKIKRLTNSARLPTNADGQSAGYDLYADLSDIKVGTFTFPGSVDIQPESTVFIHTGIAVAIPDGYFGAIYARSGLSCKQGLRPANCVGVIDASYRGEIIVALHNDSGETRTINSGDRIAQLVIQKFEPIEWTEVAELDNTERADGSFGSSGR